MDLKIKDVADLLNVSPTTIRRWLTLGKIPAYRLHGQYRFNRSEIEDWVMSQKLEKDAKPSSHLLICENQKEKAGKNKGMGSKQFSLYRALHRGGVFLDIAGDTKEEIIRNTTKKIARRLDLDADVLADLLLDRENLAPTALGSGIGVPHARDFLMNTYFDLVVAVFPQKPIAYGALDEKPVHTLFFLFACEDKRHLHLLAKLAHFTDNATTLEFLKTRPNQDVLLDFVKQWESR